MKMRTCTIALTSIALSLAACGDDESSTGAGGAGGSGATTASATTASATTTGATSATATTSGGTGGEASTTTGGAGGGGGAGGAGEGGAGGAAPLEPGFAIVDLSMPIDLTSDGRVALVQDGADVEAGVYLYDVAADELVFATSMGDALSDFATGLSDDGVVTGLHDVPVQAGFWTAEDDWTDLANPFEEGCDINEGGSWDVSRDGAIVAGVFWNACSPQAFLFRRSESEPLLLDVLGAPFDGANRPPVNRATAVSADGRVAAGFAENDVLDRSAAVWSDDGTGFLLDPDGQDAPSEVLSISADGSVVAGTYGTDGFRWTEGGGLQILPRLETAFPTDPVFPNAIVDDGTLIFGGSGDAFSGVPVAFVWSEAAGTRAVQDLAVAAGVAIPEGFVLCNVKAASADGSVLLGYGLDGEGFTRSFVLSLPPGVFDEG